MAQYNTGNIYTNEKCIGCSRCMNTCPARGANATEVRHGVRRLNVNAANCVSCGRCVSECTHGARVCRDDSDAFFAALSEGKKLSVIIDPSFYVVYGEKAGSILGWLSSLGVKEIYDASFGADISVSLSIVRFARSS